MSTAHTFLRFFQVLPNPKMEELHMPIFFFTLLFPFLLLQVLPDPDKKKAGPDAISMVEVGQ